MKHNEMSHLGVAGFSRQEFLKTSALAGITLAMGSRVQAAEAPPTRIGRSGKCVLRFAHITDSHYYVIDETAPNRVGFEKYMKSRMGWQTEKAAADVYTQIQRRNIEFALHTGDMIDYVTERDLRYFNRMTGNLPFPVHYCLGNHDYGTLTIDPDATPHWGHMDDHDANLKAWKKEVAAFEGQNYAFEQGGYKFIILNNAMRSFAPDQLAFLEHQLVASSDSPCILAFHIPLYNEQLEGILGGKGALMPPDGPIYDLLAQHRNVAAIFAGHVHRSTETKVNGIPQFTTDATYRKGFRIVECYEFFR